MRVKCPRCATLFAALPGENAKCPQCGFAARAPAEHLVPQPATPPPPSHAETAPRSSPATDASFSYRASPPRRRSATITTGRATAALLLNVVLPGSGTLLLGRSGEGALQLFLLFVGVLTLFLLVGLALVAGIWAWAVAGSIQAYFAVKSKPKSAASV